MLGFALKERLCTLPAAGIVCLFVLTAAVRGEAAARGESDTERKVDSVFAAWDKPNSPGCAVGIIRDGKLVYARGYGMADLDHNIPITQRTVFNIGSTSKQFTAASILLLAERHKLSLDDDVRKYVAELPDYGRTITIRQLLSHTSGLRDYITLLYLGGIRVEDRESVRDALETIRRQKSLNSEPGEEWLYCNTGFFLASIIVERVSGESLPQFAQHNIFGPLHMDHTVWVDDARTIVPDRVDGYAPRPGGGFELSASNWDLVGDGGIYTTLEDLLRWDQNFYRPSVGGEEMITQLTTPGTLNGGKKLEYGLGLFLGTYRGLPMERHEGEWAGYKAELLRFPAQKFSVVCLCNLSSMIPTQLAQRVADLYLAADFRPEPARPAASSGSTGEQASTLSPADSAPLLGYYRNPEDESVRRIVFKNGRLTYGRIPGAETDLIPVGDNTFRMVGVPARVDIRFVGNAGAHAARMEVAVDSSKPLVFEAFEPVTLGREQLGEYAGTYHSDELDANYSVASRDSDIVVKIRRFDDLPLTPTIRDVFKYQDFRTFTFQRDGEGRVSGFILSTARARNLPFRRVS